MAVVLFVLWLVSVVIGFVLISSVDLPFGDPGTRAREDVVVTTCYRDDRGIVVATGEVTNPTSQESDYVVEIAVETEDGVRISVTGVNVRRVRAGQTARWEAPAVDVDADVAVECVVNDARRSESR